MLKELFRSKPKYVTVRTDQASRKREVPDGLWTKCLKCANILYNKELSKNLYVCQRCGYHFRIGAWERLRQVLDDGNFTQYDPELETTNPLGFPDYEAKLERSRKATGLREAVVTGDGLLGGCRVAFGVVDFGFVGGSMGSVVGERTARLFLWARDSALPVIFFSAGGGGARMHEGILSLMQMAKTAQAVALHSNAGLLYVSVLTDPTMGGVYASFATLADVIVAEPGALIGFAGPRVVEETIRQKLPAGFQSSEFALQHGMLDDIVERKDLKRYLVRLLRSHVASGAGTPARPAEPTGSGAPRATETMSEVT